MQASPGVVGVERRAAKGVVFPGLVGLNLVLGHLGHGLHLGHSLLGDALYTLLVLAGVLVTQGWVVAPGGGTRGKASQVVAPSGG